jgi:putative membrane protein
MRQYITTVALGVTLLTGIAFLNFFYTAKALGKDNKTTLTLLHEEDIEFAKKACEMGMQEVKLAEMAKTKAVSADVKKLAEMMYKDHTAANEELKMLAGKLNITLPTMLSEKSQKKNDDLMKKSGNDFDKEYTDCMVKDHKEAIKLFEKESKDGKEEMLKTWAAGKLSALNHHLEMSQQTDEMLKKTKK